MGLFWLLAGLAVACAGACAQEPAPQDGPVHTLRVFANLIQIPTLVLDAGGRPVEERTQPKFTVSLDGGKPFAATHVRLEGEDPISLTVLLDASGAENELLRELSWALPPLAGTEAGKTGLRTHDHVSVYAMDCVVVKAVQDVPAERLALKAGLEHALKSPILHGTGKRGACAHTARLRDALIALARALGELPGRRVILAVTGGADDASTQDWLQVRTAMQHYGVTVFGLAQTVQAGTTTLSARGMIPMAMGTNVAVGPGEFAAMCETSGGLMLTADETNVKERLTEFTRLLRARYIVQFPRAETMTSGNHVMAIKVTGKNYFVRSTGASVPIADPKLKDDPTVLRVPVEQVTEEEPHADYFR